MNNKERISQAKRKRIIIKIRKKVFGTKQKPRLSVYRSLKHIYAQLIDDESGRTLVSTSDLSLSQAKKSKKLAEKNKEESKNQIQSRKVVVAYEVGKLLAEAAEKKHIKRVVFDRRGFRYHGRIKSLAEGARAGGLEF